MQKRLPTVLLAMILTAAAVPALAAPEAKTSANVLEAIFAPAPSAATSGVPSAVPPPYYYGYCSQTCQRCESTAPQPCPPDPDTGFRQSCTRIRLC